MSNIGPLVKSGVCLDLREGVILELDCFKRTLTFVSAKTSMEEIVIENLPKDTAFYPIVLFHTVGYYPVQISYIGGSKGISF